MDPKVRPRLPESEFPFRRGFSGFHISGFFVATLFLIAGNSNTALIGQETSQKAQQASSADASEISQLISNLGSAEFGERSQAEAKLMQIGARAIGPLREALGNKNSDNEIRLTSRRLLILVERRAKAQKTEDFLAGKGKSIDFAGWDDFSSIVGDKRNARRLFIQLHESQPALLRQAFPNPDKNQSTTKTDFEAAEDKFQSFARTLYLSSNGNATTIVAKLSVALFLAGNKFQLNSGPPRRFNVNKTSTSKIVSVLQKPQMIAAIKNSNDKDTLKSLITNWLDSVPNNPDQLMANKIAIIEGYELDCAEIILGIAVDEKAPVRIRANALETLSRVGNSDVCQRISSIFEDKAIVGNFLPITENKPANEKSKPRNLKSRALVEVQIRDLALATVILLNQKEISDFGFLSTAKDDNGLLFSQAGFTSDDQRQNAFAKWHSASTE